MFVPLVSAISQLYETLVGMWYDIFSVLLSVLNDEILFIKDHSSEKPMYMIPMLSLRIGSWRIHKFRFNETDEYMLAEVHFVKNGAIHSMLSKGALISTIKQEVRRVSYVELDKARRELMKKYIFVELGGRNISKYFYDIGWSLTKKIQVDDIQKIFSESADTVMEFTDDNLFVVKKSGQDVVYDHFDFMKRS